MQAATALRSLIFYKNSCGKKMVILEEGNKSQHTGSTYGGTKYQMPKEELMPFAGLFHATVFFFCVRHRKHACFMVAGSNKFDIAQNKRYLSSIFSSIVYLLLFISAQSKCISLTKQTFWDFFLEVASVCPSVMWQGRNKALSKSLSKSIREY